MDFTDPTIFKTLIVAGAGIIGAIIGGYVKALSSRQKIIELNYNYSQKLQDTYLEKAREYTESVYAPLSIALANLSYGFRKIRTNIGDDNNDTLANEFASSIDEFNSIVMDLMSKGAGAFLTVELDEKLQSFVSFLEYSLKAEHTSLKAIFGFALPFFGNGYQKKEIKITGKYARSFWSPRLSLSVIGLGASYEAKEILAAPVTSKDFEERFVRDAHIINVLIKEVTLGAKAKQS